MIPPEGEGEGVGVGSNHCTSDVSVVSWLKCWFPSSCQILNKRTLCLHHLYSVPSVQRFFAFLLALPTRNTRCKYCSIFAFNFFHILLQVKAPFWCGEQRASFYVAFRKALQKYLCCDLQKL